MGSAGARPQHKQPGSSRTQSYRRRWWQAQ